MIFLFDTAANNNNALAIGATWFHGKHRDNTPLNAGFYLAAQGANVHDIVLMIDAQNRVINANIAPALQALVAGEAVIIVAHGDYANRRLTSEAGGLNVTATVTTIVQHFLQIQNPPSAIFIAACNSGIALQAGSILSTVTGNVYADQCVVGGYVGEATLGTIGPLAFITDSTGAALNVNRFGEHIFAVRDHGQNSYHMGYDIATTTRYTSNGNYSNPMAQVRANQLARWIPGNQYNNVACITLYNDPAFALNRIPVTISGTLEQVV